MFPFLSIYMYCRHLPLPVSFIFHSTARRIQTDAERQAASVTEGVERFYPGYYKTLVVAKQERVAAREATSVTIRQHVERKYLGYYKACYQAFFLSSWCLAHLNSVEVILGECDPHPLKGRKIYL